MAMQSMNQSHTHLWQKIDPSFFSFCVRRFHNGILKANSSTEAEFIAPYEAAKIVRFMLKGLGFPENMPSQIHVDD